MKNEKSKKSKMKNKKMKNYKLILKNEKMKK
jgi:hypothetical protein